MELFDQSVSFVYVCWMTVSVSVFLFQNINYKPWKIVSAEKKCKKKPISPSFVGIFFSARQFFIIFFLHAGFTFVPIDPYTYFDEEGRALVL